MTTGNALAAPAPSVTVPVIRADRVEDLDAAIPAFTDDVWPLAALGRGVNLKPVSINFLKCPEPYRDAAKLYAWHMINEPAPVALKTLGSKHTDEPSAETVTNDVNSLMMFLRWLAPRQPVENQPLNEVSDGTLNAYLAHLKHLTHATGKHKGKKLTGATINRRLASAERLHAYAAALPEEHRLRMPPWLLEDMKLRKGQGHGGKKRPGLTERQSAALLAWAEWFVNEFADDILAATTARDKLLARTPKSTSDQVGRALRRYVKHHGTIPTMQTTHGTEGVANQYLFGRGMLSGNVARMIGREFGDVPRVLGAPLGIDIQGRINNTPWVTDIDYYDVDMWRLHLATACMIIVGLSIGSRPQEFLTLEVDSVRCYETPNAQVRWIVDGHLRKGQRDPRGRQLRDGIPVTWVANRHVATALTVTGQLAPKTRYAFTPDVRSGGKKSMAALGSQPANERIISFTTKINELAHLHNLPDERFIPTGVDDAIIVSQFRPTTLAQIGDQEGGVIAAADQAKHNIGVLVKTLDVTGGYCDMRDIGQLTFERRRERAQRSTDRVVTELLSGAGVSGNAAKRVIGLVANQGIETARYIPEKQLKSVTRNRNKQLIYDNAATSLLCMFNGGTAKCGDPASPDFGQCQLSCPNHATTDAGLPGLKAKVASLRAEAKFLAEPKQRQKNRLADQYQEILERHEKGAIHVIQG